MKSATGLTGQERDGGDLYADAAAELTHEGAIGLVFGSPGREDRNHARRGAGVELEAMAEIEGPVLALLDEIAQELSGFGSGNKGRRAVQRLTPLHSQEGGKARPVSEARIGPARRSHPDEDGEVDPAGRVVRDQQAEPIRSGNRAAPRIRRRQRQVDRGGRLQRIDRHGRDVSPSTRRASSRS